MPNAAQAAVLLAAKHLLVLTSNSTLCAHLLLAFILVKAGDWYVQRACAGTGNKQHPDALHYTCTSEAGLDEDRIRNGLPFLGLQRVQSPVQEKR